MVEYKCKKDKEKSHKTRKAFIMKKNSLRTLVAFLNGETVDVTEVKAELEAELAKGEEKAQQNRKLYADAHDVAMAVLGETPLSVSDWFDLCSAEMPEGFTKSKLQYAVREYWSDEVVKIEGGKVNMYRKKA